MAGPDVIRVVHRLQNAQEDNNLDLSACHLLRVPDAVYLMLRDVSLETADLSNNRLRQIPAQFAINFKHITELRLHGNQVISLPNELGELSRVRELDLSGNEFSHIPEPVYNMAGLRCLKADNNNITDVDVEKLMRMPGLEEVNLQDNPLNDAVRRRLEELNSRLVIKYTQPEIPNSYEGLD